jgi:hypothetical protein
MSNDDKDLTKQADDLEERLARESKRLDEGQIGEEQLRELAEEGDDSLLARAASRAIAHVEREKDNPQALSQEITQKYLAMGRDLLSDDSAHSLDDRVRARVTKLIGTDPGDVRIHTGERAGHAAEALGARAFAVGDSDIYFGRGQFNPETPEGLGVLVHELTHTTDNLVGAAFSTDKGGADYSAAEARAEATERLASQEFGPSQAANLAEDADEEEPEIDMDELEAAVTRLMRRGSELGADRSGSSGR